MRSRTPRTGARGPPRQGAVDRARSGRGRQACWVPRPLQREAQSRFGPGASGEAGRPGDAGPHPPGSPGGRRWPGDCRLWCGAQGARGCPVSPAREPPSPCSLCAARVTGDCRPGPLSVQVTGVPLAHEALDRARWLLRLQEPLVCSVGASSLCPLWGCPATSQDKRAACRSPPTARQVKLASPWSHRSCRGGRSR